ncbi:MAG TPA: hypothetical protein VJ086_08750 [Rubrobacteraceae bacterium]|nr:hypothetical protein [Rubrobacteraceae bacterium]
MLGEETPIPEAWLGRPVRLVFLDGASTEYAEGDLEEVNDRGIVMSVETHVGHPAQPLFYPWSAVIQLSEAREP